MDSDRIARVVVGLAVALGLAVLGAHPRLRALERRLGVTVLMSAGLPFLGLGAFFRLESVGILTEPILADLRPAFEFGLGWIGFAVGMQFDIRRLDRLPRAAGSVIAVESLAPMMTAGVACLACLVGLGVPASVESIAPDVMVLAACAAGSAPVIATSPLVRHGRTKAGMVRAISDLDDVASLAVLGLVAILWRPSAELTEWLLPTSAWLLVALGLGTLLGALSYVLLRGARSEIEQLALLIGVIALASGMSSYLRLSVPVTCAIAGALLANLPMRDQTIVRGILYEVERPIYLVFLVVAGASWRPDEWQGWVLAPVFVLSRVLGKSVGSRWASRLAPDDLPPVRDLALALMPQSPFAIVLIVSAAGLIGPSQDRAVRWAINAVIIGGVLTEVVVRILERATERRHRERLRDSEPPLP